MLQKSHIIFIYLFDLSRALRKDLPITPKTAISKEDQKQLDDEINVSWYLFYIF